MYVVVTRQGYGDLFAFRTYNAADEHPLYQYGDPILHDGRSVARAYNQLEMPGLLTKLGHPLMARQMEAEFAKLSAVEKSRKLLDYGELAWQYIKAQAVEPPTDPETICKMVSQDRRKTKHKEFIMAKAKKVAEDTLVEGEVAEKPAKEKKAKAPKEPGSSGRTRVDGSFVITLLSDKEGNKYGSENNPKRAGSASHGRFAIYRDGMTVQEAIDAGARRDDITWDVNKGYITLSAA